MHPCIVSTPSRMPHVSIHVCQTIYFTTLQQISACICTPTNTVPSNSLPVTSFTHSTQTHSILVSHRKPLYIPCHNHSIHTYLPFSFFSPFFPLSSFLLFFPPDLGFGECPPGPTSLLLSPASGFATLRVPTGTPECCCLNVVFRGWQAGYPASLCSGRGPFGHSSSWKKPTSSPPGCRDFSSGRGENPPLPPCHEEASRRTDYRNISFASNSSSSFKIANIPCTVIVLQLRTRTIIFVHRFT